LLKCQLTMRKDIVASLGLTFIMCSCGQPAAVPNPDALPDAGTNTSPDGGADAGMPGAGGSDAGPDVVGPMPVPSCGDGHLQAQAGEVCDDGNDADDDGCSSDCRVASCFAPVTHASLQALLDDGACPVAYLYAGTYRENVRMDRNAVIQGVGADAVIIDGDGDGPVFEILGADVTLQGLTVQGGQAERGGGVYIEGGALTLVDVKIRDNRASGTAQAAGGGIYGLTAQLTLIRTEVSGNQVISNEQGRGGGIHIESTRLVIDQGSAVTGNAVHVEGGAGPAEAQGGGIFQQGGQILLAAGSSVSQNLARAQGPGSADPEVAVIARGGGVAMHEGSLELSAEASLYGNRAEAESACRAEAQGGAVFMQALSPRTGEDISLRLSLTRGLVIDNHASARSTGEEVCSAALARGGAVYANSRRSDDLGIAVAERSQISDNRAEARAALWWTSTAQGGGVYVAGDGYPRARVAVADSSMSDNAALSDGLAQGGAGFLGTLTHDADVALELVRSTASDNRAESVSGIAEGGALRLSGKGTDAVVKVEVTNSTLSNNQSISASGTGRGGAISVARVSNEVDVILALYSATVAENHATITGGGIDVRDYVPVGQAQVELQNTILAGNRALIGPDCATDPEDERLRSRGYNLIGSIDGCHFQRSGATDLVGVEAHIGPLGWNGGPTMTQPLLPESPAIDAGDPGGCRDGDNNVLTADQRGWQRVGRCDIGACEAVYD
jgi:cysteine-rich repeat protein